MRVENSLATYISSTAALSLAGALAGVISFPARAQMPPTCPDPTPTTVDVEDIPIVVTSTIDDYFVLYANFDVDGEEVEFPVAVVRGEAGTTTLEENVEALSKERYRELSARLRDAGIAPDVNAEGNNTLQRWVGEPGNR